MDISFFAHDLNVIFTGGVFGTTALADNITKLENKNTMCINASRRNIRYGLVFQTDQPKNEYYTG